MPQENIDYVVCKVCGFQGQTLNRHLAKHSMTADEYHLKFPDARVACESVMERQAESVTQAWQAKPKVEKPKEEHVCSHCGGKFSYLCNYVRHLEREKVFILGQEGKDYVTCKICGMRADSLEPHVRATHLMTIAVYQQMHGGEVISQVWRQKQSDSQKGKPLKPIAEKRGSKQCPHCGDWFIFGGETAHLQDCMAKHPDKYTEGRDYVKCPDCGNAFLHLGRHLRKEHGWDKDKLAKAVNEGLQLSAEVVKNRWSDGQNMAAIQQTREIAMKEKYGVANPFSFPEVQKKIRQTNQGRYGVSHPMQNAEVFSRQQASAQNGPSGQEVFFMEHVTSPSVVYTGYGGRFIRTKTGVKKYGRVIKDLNPDFMVFPDNVLESATAASQERRKLDNLKHRTKYVIELLGDWYHSEQVIGVPPAEHERQIVEAYKSAGIECLALWEHDVMEHWDLIQPGVEAWIQRAVTDINCILLEEGDEEQSGWSDSDL